jgi:uncharacterized membrane protein YeaQ/YmgE (transglycosylase-associated protein family)
MGGLISWIIVGLVAGVLAKALTPGTNREPKGCLMTIGLGMAGSLLIGFLMQVFLGSSGGGGLLGSIVGATIGAMLLIYLARKFWR